MSNPKNINGGGPQGATLGILEYLAQSNDSADCVPLEQRFKFIDDLTILEVVNLLTIGLSSANLKAQVLSDLPLHGQIIPASNLKSQEWLNHINDWTKSKKMLLNENKCKSMIFNFTRNSQFTTKLEINDQNIEVVKSTKLLGTILTDDLKWDANTTSIIRKANASMEILRKTAAFGASKEDLVTIYKSFVRSHLEQCAPVWHSSLSAENTRDLERVQKSAIRIILGGKYCGYKKSFAMLELESLETRRRELCVNFAKKCINNPKLSHMFPIREKNHHMDLRNRSKFKVQFSKCERLKKSAIVYMQNLLNEEEIS